MNVPPLVLVVDDQPQNLDILVSYLARSELQLAIATNGLDALELAQERQPDLILLDVMMPDLSGFEVCQRLKADPNLASIPIIFMSALADSDSRVQGFTVGGADYIPKPLYREEVLARIHAQLTLVQQRQELETRNQQLESINRDLQDQINLRQQAEDALSRSDATLSVLTRQEAKRWGIDAFIGQSQPVQQLLSQIGDLQTAASTNVLVLGESGTGKELVSRAMHFGSPRRERPFIAVNCSSIPAELADAEFFGHTKGAYTGAVSDRSGYFEQAHGGTLFLDEVGDMPLALQAKLLRVLEDGLITPIGSSRPRQVNVRVIAATNADMQTHIKSQNFRQDLYFRLAGYVLSLPPLRERPSDIALLTEHFLRQLSQQMGREQPGMSAAARQALATYSYPGNVRELRNLIEFALIASRGHTIRPEHLHFLPSDETPVSAPSPLAPAPDAPDALAVPDALAAPDALASQQESSGTTDKTDKDEVRLLAYAAQEGRINNHSVQELLGADHGRASYLLKKLHKEGRLEKQGERRWTYYVIPTSGHTK